MGALPRPDLAPGPARELNQALHALHHRAGWPSLRMLARDAGCSHTTVSHVFSSSRLPTWGVLELLVEAMGGETAEFHSLWLAASAPSNNGTTPPPTIAGRRTELAAVRQHLETGSGLLLVAGEAGMGKTKLVTTAAQLVTPEVFVATGQCLPLATQVAFMPFADALRGAYLADCGGWFARAIEGKPTFVKTALSRLLPELDVAHPSTVLDDSARLELFAAVGVTLASLAAERPLALLLEDLHWADSATLDLATHLVSRHAAWPLLGTWRLHDPAAPDVVEARLTQLRRQPMTKVLELTPLRQDETAAQLAQLGLDAPPDVVARIYRRTEGQPLFTEQLAFAADEGADLPRVLTDLLDRRLKGISPAAWSIARTLGVAERPLTAEQLAETTALSDGELLSGMHQLHDRRLIRSNAQGSVELEHPMLAEAVKRRLVAGERPGVHRGLANVLGQDPDASAAEVAAHWQGAGDSRQELPWRIKAAREAANRFAASQEAEQWLRVLELWPDCPVAEGIDPSLTRTRVSIHAMLALRPAGRLTRALELLDQARLWMSEMSATELATIHVRSAKYLGETGHATQSLAELEPALEILERLPLSTDTVDAWEQRSWRLADVQRFEEADAATYHALELGEQIGDIDLLFLLLCSVATREAMTGDLRSALARIERARLISRSAGPFSEILMGVCTTDILLLHNRPAHEVLAAGRPALEAARTFGITDSHASAVMANVAESYLVRGLVAEAGELIDPATDADVTIDDWIAQLARVRLDSARGALGLASSRLAAIFELPVADILDVSIDAARLDLWAGRPRAALERLESAIGRGPMSDYWRVQDGLVLAVRAAADLRDRHGAGPLSERVRRMAAHDWRHPRAAPDFPPTRRASAATWTAEFARLESTATIEHWTQATTEWDKLERPHDAAYCRWRTAQVALASGEASLVQKLLRRAARDAREHVPLLTAIRQTAARGS